MSYDRTIAAALAETVSKFRLAEALALDIPPQRGRDAETRDKLIEVRRAIIDAGGEPRDVETLANYRRTAQWVILPSSGEFAWVKGASFSAHSEARERGIDYQDFATRPRSVDVIRREAGGAGTDGQPASIVKGWTEQQKTEAARALMADPEAAKAAASALMQSEAGRQAVVQAQSKRYEDDGRSHPEPPTPPIGVLAGINDSLFDIRWKLRSIHEQQAKLRSPDREPVAGSLEIISRQAQVVADIVRDPDAGRITDKALQDLLSGGE